MITANQNPEQHVRDEIDKMLTASGRQVQSKNQNPFAAGVGVAVRESTGELTGFTNYRDPKPLSRPVFTFLRPETFDSCVLEGISKLLYVIKFIIS